ncbi:alpha/beta fold hydrolase [Streptomyces turgidiscabies]|uniref:Hydrolase, alpha/beta domain protein n=1 Tax=Streptomyces turgidiscabies (strain Car8) TaxID=698760 RepID=L7FF03_STRT8|nr:MULTISPECIES: alpha/beta hydrolase [Streptomyces]ELP69255.1 hydrolase, alpha/beta domain protein [Streptomyces turgidiscabies Car8]MDX3493122.1 alpha/beta hydrolase [Streptomyces turgidiscabies]GAQ70419.1 2-hydroxy-6-oxo-6-phenylhexa-2,4-dienoate hydrolase [Streptomyces turgidiscabies]
MTLAHDVAGDGPALVLLHSGVCDRGMWDAQWQALIDAGYRLVRCDLRGFGETPAPDRPHSDAEDVLALLNSLGIAQAALVGSSYGGQVALEIAARRPDRVSAVGLICSALPGHEPSAELSALGEREEALLDAGDIVGATELMVETWLGPDADETAREAVRRMQRHAFELQLAAAEEFEPLEAVVDLAAVQAPCLVLSGAHDLADFRQIAARLPHLLANADHVELPWAGHLPSLERPSAVTELLIAFLAERVPVG